MAEYIEREAFLKSKREQYCEDCNRRKNSKGKMVYDIGDAPCRACSIDDILVDVEDFPAADVIERKQGMWTDANLNFLYKCSCPYCGTEMRGQNRRPPE